MGILSMHPDFCALMNDIEVHVEDQFVRRQLGSTQSQETLKFLLPIWRLRSLFNDALRTLYKECHTTAPGQVPGENSLVSSEKMLLATAAIREGVRNRLYDPSLTGIIHETRDCYVTYQRYIRRMKELYNRTKYIYNSISYHKIDILDEYTESHNFDAVACKNHYNRIVYVLEMSIVIADSIEDAIKNAQSVIQCARRNLETMVLCYQNIFNLQQVDARNAPLQWLNQLRLDLDCPRELHHHHDNATKNNNLKQSPQSVETNNGSLDDKSKANHQFTNNPNSGNNYYHCLKCGSLDTKILPSSRKTCVEPKIMTSLVSYAGIKHLTGKSDHKPITNHRLVYEARNSESKLDQLQRKQRLYQECKHSPLFSVIRVTTLTSRTKHKQQKIPGVRYQNLLNKSSIISSAKHVKLNPQLLMLSQPKDSVLEYPQVSGNPIIYNKIPK